MLYLKKNSVHFFTKMHKTLSLFLKVFNFWVTLSPKPPTRASPLDPIGAKPPNPHYRLAIACRYVIPAPPPPNSIFWIPPDYSFMKYRGSNSNISISNNGGSSNIVVVVVAANDCCNYRRNMCK